VIFYRIFTLCEIGLGNWRKNWSSWQRAQTQATGFSWAPSQHQIQQIIFYHRFRKTKFFHINKFLYLLKGNSGDLDQNHQRAPNRNASKSAQSVVNILAGHARNVLQRGGIQTNSLRLVLFPRCCCRAQKIRTAGVEQDLPFQRWSVSNFD